MKNVIRTFVLGILAGALIGLGGALNLTCGALNNPIAGGIFFSLGLMCVCILGANLFTGKVGYVLEKDKRYLIDIFIMMAGNVLGAMLIGYIFALINPSWNVPLASKYLYGEGASWYGCILRSILAGVFVYLAVECFRSIENYAAKLIMVCLSIASMVLLGCNHSIANVFYFSYAHIVDGGYDMLNGVVSVIVSMLGNALGSILIYLLQKGLKNVIKPKQEEN